MRILVTIPHYSRHAEAGGGFYGSECDPADQRAANVGRCLASLHQTFGPKQVLSGPVITQANTALRHDVEVVLVTSNDDHLVDRLPRHLFFHQPTTIDPRALGFVCHTIMRDSVDHFDWFVFLEDDIAVTDPLLFQKLAWFDSLFGPQALLQPNRFEVAADTPVRKLYIDGETIAPTESAKFQDISIRPHLQAEAMGAPVLFQRTDNVHSGCFIVNGRQVRRLLENPRFGTPSAEFFGPLETAATLPVMTSFDVYKPSRENASFLEVEHLARRFISLAYAAAPPAASDETPA